MCGICFICTLSGQQSKLDFNTETNGNITSSSDIGVNDIISLPVSSTAREQQEQFVNILFSDALLHRRGPDVSTKHVFTLTEGLDGYMQGCVLHLRGQITPQPIKDVKGNALMWNGEIFYGIKPLNRSIGDAKISTRKLFSISIYGLASSIHRNQSLDDWKSLNHETTQIRVQVEDHENDTEVLFNHLVSSITEEDVLKTMQKIHGPWAFIFWQADAQKLWFGRDMFGRRSLLWHLPLSSSDHLVLSSVALGEMTYTEIPSVGIFCLDFSKLSIVGDDASESSLLTLYPWKHCIWPGTTVAVTGTKETDILTYLYPNLSTYLSASIDRREILDIWIPDVNKHLPETGTSLLNLDSDIANNACLEDALIHILKNRSDLDALADELIKILQVSVDKRVNNLPREYSSVGDSHHPPDEAQNHHGSRADLSHQISYTSVPENEIHQLSLCESKGLASCANVAILFSGGLDSSILAALADRCVPEDEPIDLLNVAFEQPVVKSIVKKKHKDNKKKQKRASEKEQNMTASESRESTDHPTSLSKMCDASASSEYCEYISYKATESHHSKQGCCLHKSSPADQLASSQDMSSCVCPNVSDHSHICSKVTINAVHIGDSINFRKDIMPNVTCSGSFDVPDRQTGRIALSELNPKRRWNFVEINVSQAELHSFRNSHIRKLIYPLHTVLDDSIGCAVWFAARGSGVLAQDISQKFVSRARVILCGMAADEQFAGYSRHRVTFKTNGWEGLLKEIQEEMWRISARNLGRDDRIITDHGKECRFPFLDETFTQLVGFIPVHKRADLRLPRGVGDKLLLRLSALKLGLLKTASQPKRAIQFGSKIAKLDNRKEKGSDICDRLI